MTRDEKIEAFRKAIIAQADAMGDSGWMTIDVPTSIREDGRLRVPKAPFELWAVALSGGSHLVASWTNVSPVGVKQGADDPNHTDWMLGAGLGPLDMKTGGPNPMAEVLSAAAYAARAEVERRVLAFDCSVLLQGHTVTGRVHIPAVRDDFPTVSDDGIPPVTVVKNAGPDWLEMAIKTFQLGGAVIVERGGEMAHLVTELRATGGGAIIRKEKARALYPAGSLLKAEPAVGRLTLEEDRALVSERAAAAFNAAPLEDDPVVSVEPPPPHQPGFGIVPHNPNKRHPSSNTTLYEPCFKLQSANWDLYAAWEYDKGGRYDPHYGYEMYLSIWAYRNPRDTDRGPRPHFHSDKRIWKDGELSQAVHDVLYMIDPEAKFAGQRLSEEFARQRQAEKAKIAELSDDRIIHEMRRLGREEDGLWEEKEGGDLTQQEYTSMLIEYNRLFRIYTEIARERGIELDMGEIRPFIASQDARDNETLERMDAQQRAFDEYMRSTPPLNKPLAPRM
ncbi:hypothetical protein OIU34_21990 [Pararhizobium sp. BT-229]|uniref:hypothetical protein n=1 Tax=Pararhizobium sp. BT-229 TaxID=2986923 RepID=UPI0021F75AEB|nr:hypothetical protein [Pararhizobium sp. BT-229]MCV9964564.1 hypothetical protein [Pararhizobium sp. BT-229]